jgi:pimeloyl-ACP methyl ester carboxylesterase
MVHGFSSNWQAWERYLGEQGYLTGVGLRGFAVGDGQVEGVLNTGAIHQPTGRTNTIAQNADILGRYIDQVQALTGAEKVDLLAHSMGGLISRYYIDRVMQEDVAQLIMLGSPMAGTDCANLPASLGYYLPAVLEIQPSYVIGIFNQQITDRHGVPFHAIAGVPIIDPVASPCTPVPTDIAVSLDSVGAIPLNLVQTPVLHTELNTSEDVFTDSVLPLLRTPAGQFTAQADSSLPVNVLEAVPLNRVYTGHLDSGETADLAIQIEPGLSVASFALFDPTQSLTVTVYGASGNMIELDAQKNGLTVVDDPSALLHLGYGFANPKPGPWQIKLQTTERTPPGGADYAITAALRGGAVLEAQTNLLLPEVDQPVHITARLLLGGQVLPLETAEATVLAPDGGQLTLPLAPEMDQARVEWTPQSAGLHSLVVSVVGRLPDGSPVERVEFMTVEAQPEKGGSMLPIVLTLGGMAILFFLGVVGIVLLLVMLRRQKAN